MAASQGYTFEKTARVILRDNKQKNTTASALVLSEFGLGADSVNIANESYVVKSTELMYNVVNRLKLNVSYWIFKDIRQLNLYTDTPVTVDFPVINEKKRCELTLTFLNDNRYNVSYKTDETSSSGASSNSIEGTLNKPLQLPFGTIIVRPTAAFTPKTSGKPIIVRRTSLRNATDTFLGQLTITRPDAKESSLIELQLRTTHPKKAEDILNSLIVEYNDQSTAEKQTMAKQAEEFLAKRLRILSTDLDEVDENILNFRTEHKMVIDSTTSIGANYTSLMDTNREEFNINTQLKQITQLVSSLSSQSSKYAMLPVNLGIEDRSISGQIEQYNKTCLKYSQLKESAGSKNTIGDYAKVGTRSILVTGKHRHSPDGNCICKEGMRGDIVIGKGSVISTQAIVQPNISIGSMSFLVELSQVILPFNWQDSLFRLQASGCIPVLAHPERYGNVLTLEELTGLHHSGIEFQINLSSISGLRGSGVQKLAQKLQRLVPKAWIGTDARHPRHLRLKP